jgi:hypothetical protein
MKLLSLFAISLFATGCSRSIRPEVFSNAKPSKSSALCHFDEQDSYSYYLLKFYAINERDENEDFSFESVTTSDRIGNAQKGKIIQFVAIYIFKNGGVIYHFPYKNRYQSYTPIVATAFDGNLLVAPSENRKYKLYGWVDTVGKAEAIVPLMADSSKAKGTIGLDGEPISHLSLQRADTITSRKHLNRMEYISVEPAKTDAFVKSKFDGAVQQIVKEQKGYVPKVNSVTHYRHMQICLQSPARGNGKPKRRINLICKAMYENNDTSTAKAILIIGIDYLKEIRSRGDDFTRTTMSKTFDFGMFQENSETKAALWFKVKPGNE